MKQAPNGSNPVDYRVSEDKWAALSHADRYAKQSVRQDLQPVGGTGLEVPRENAGETVDSNRGGAECGALGAREAPADPELAAVIEVWPTLPDAIRRAVLAIVESATKQ